MPATVILNPYSNRWQARQRAPEVKTALRTAGIEFNFLEMERPGQGIDLAREAVEKGNLRETVTLPGDEVEQFTAICSRVIQHLESALSESLPPKPTG